MHTIEQLEMPPLPITMTLTTRPIERLEGPFVGGVEGPLLQLRRKVAEGRRGPVLANVAAKTSSACMAGSTRVEEERRSDLASTARRRTPMTCVRGEQLG